MRTRPPRRDADVTGLRRTVPVHKTNPVHKTKEDVMKVWKRPRIREITCGMEINGYFPAEI